MTGGFVIALQMVDGSQEREKGLKHGFDERAGFALHTPGSDSLWEPHSHPAAALPSADLPIRLLSGLLKVSISLGTFSLGLW